MFDPVHYLALLDKKPGGFDHARPLEDWDLSECFQALRRRMETEPGGLGTREFIRTLRLLESCSASQLADAVDYALDIGIHDADSIRVILEHRRESPSGLFSLDGRPQQRAKRVAQNTLTRAGWQSAASVNILARRNGGLQTDCDVSLKST